MMTDQENLIFNKLLEVQQLCANDPNLAAVDSVLHSLMGSISAGLTREFCKEVYIITKDFMIPLLAAK